MKCVSGVVYSEWRPNLFKLFREGTPCVCVCSYYSKDFEKVNTIFILHHFSNMSL